MSHVSDIYRTNITSGTYCIFGLNMVQQMYSNIVQLHETVRYVHLSQKLSQYLSKRRLVLL